MNLPAHDIHLRPETPSDEAFLARLFASTRVDEVASLPGGEGMRATFLRLQFLAQRAGHRAQHPDAERSIVLVDGQLAGRLIVDRSGDATVLVDIALLPESRGRGTGGGLLGALLAEARAAGRAVRLHVLRTNPAARLYERLGFLPAGGDEMYAAMEWHPPRGDPQVAETPS